MDDVLCWTIRRKPGAHNVFEVVSFDDRNQRVIIAKEFRNLEQAQEFAIEANLMISRGVAKIKNI